MKRDERLASNKTDGNRLFLNEVTNCSHDVIVQHLCTSPFIELDTIRKAISVVGDWEKPNSFDSCLLVRKDKQYQWKDGEPVYDKYNSSKIFFKRQPYLAWC